jgi:DNA-binding NarL/FixJ family response regulator
VAVTAELGKGVGSILVADSDATSCAVTCGLLQRIGYTTREARSGDEALALAVEDRPLLVLIDVELAGVNGYETCRELRDRWGERLPIVLLSANRTDVLDRTAGLLIGADDYVVKPFDPGELLARVRALLRRRSGATNGKSGNHLLEMLTLREREVLDLLAQGLTQAEIANRLYVTPKTVATHIQRVLSKLGVHSRAQAVALALGNDRHVDFAAHALVAERVPA